MVMMGNKRTGWRKCTGSWKPRSDVTAILFALLLALFPLGVDDPYILNVLVISMISAVLTASWNLICGYTGIFTFGHQAFFGIGAYASALLAIKAGLSPWLGLLVGGGLAAVLSFLIGLPCLRLRAAPYIAIMTLAFSEIVRISCMNLVGLTRGEMGLWGIPNFPNIVLPAIGTVSFGGGSRVPSYYLMLAIFAITMGVLYFIVRSPAGLAFRSLRDSQEAAESLGVHVTYYKLLAFVISAFFAGMIGSFYAHYILILTPTSVFSIGTMVEIMAMALIGGLGTFLGPVVAAFGLTVGLEYLRFLGDYRFITYGIVLVVVVLFLSEGLGKKAFRDRGVAQ
jgi:branched-chain amino acid transport system permease protein